uniref:Neurofilament medium polypeptide-like n=1 Tax=Nicotiana tabacum TaxID=4097 RepID=A0A1S3X6T7_TOBAC|nr:PREDICTED: neurofilament medium polypeptide-like [Nicotiana tabacum]
MKTEAEEWKKNIDRLASEKEVVRAQLASAETQLRGLKEKALVQAKEIEEFQSRLGSTNFDLERLATELAVAESVVETSTANADAMVAVYRSDAEAAQVRAMEVAKAAQARANLVENAKFQSQRETLEEIHSYGFDLTTEIENAKELEVEAIVLDFPDDDDTGSMSGSESEEASRTKMLLPERTKSFRIIRGPQAQNSKGEEEEGNRSCGGLRDEEEEEEEDALALVVRSAKAIEVAKPSEPMEAIPVGVGSDTPMLDQSALSDSLGTMIEGRLPSLPTFSEEAISKFRADLSQCELLCGQKDEVIKDLQADLVKAREEEAELDKQLRGIKQKRSAQDKRIEELETRLVEAKAEIEPSKVMTGKSISMETLEEIHTRGFELSEEIARAKALEIEASQLVSFDDEDDAEEGSQGGSDEEPEGEAVPEGDIDSGRS